MLITTVHSTVHLLLLKAALISLTSRATEQAKNTTLAVLTKCCLFTQQEFQCLVITVRVCSYVGGEILHLISQTVPKQHSIPVLHFWEVS